MKLLGIVLLVAAVLGLSYQVKVEYNQLLTERNAESACIKQLISAGWERRDIGTRSGTCYTGTNAYYK